MLALWRSLRQHVPWLQALVRTLKYLQGIADCHSQEDTQCTVAEGWGRMGMGILSLALLGSQRLLDLQTGCCFSWEHWLPLHGEAHPYHQLPV